MHRALLLIASRTGAFAACMTLVSCSAFESSRQMDMTPFSQNAATMYAEVAKLSTPFQFRELQRYMDEPAITRLRTRAVPIIAAWRGIVSYSNQVVALNNSRLSESQKNSKLAEYILRIRERIIQGDALKGMEFEFGGLDSVIANIRSAPTYLDGLDAASPLISEFVYAISSELDTVSSYIQDVMAAFQQRIEADQTDQKRNFFGLRNLQARFQHAQVLLYRARLEEPGAFDSLLAADPSLKEFLNPRGGVSGKNWRDAEEALVLRLERIHRSMQHLDLETQFYRARQNEAQEWREQIDVKIKIARDGLMVWSQSHQNLGKGIPVPPLIDVMGMAGGLAKKVVPIP